MENTQTVDERTLLRRVMMMRKGLKQRALAEQWNTSQSFVSQLISGKCRSELHERKFAEIVGLPREQLFEVNKSNAKSEPKPDIPHVAPPPSSSHIHSFGNPLIPTGTDPR
jgi:hypothetical protein